MDQWERTENPEINPYIDIPLIFDKKVKLIQGKTFYQMVLEITDIYL